MPKVQNFDYKQCKVKIDLKYQLYAICIPNLEAIHIRGQSVMQGSFAISRIVSTLATKWGAADVRGFDIPAVSRLGNCARLSEFSLYVNDNSVHFPFKGHPWGYFSTIAILPKTDKIHPSIGPVGSCFFIRPRFYDRSDFSFKWLN